MDQADGVICTLIVFYNMRGSDVWWSYHIARLAQTEDDSSPGEHAGADCSAVGWQIFKDNLGSHSRSGKRNPPSIAEHIETFPAYEDPELQKDWRLEECLWEAGCLHALVLRFSRGVCFDWHETGLATA